MDITTKDVSYDDFAANASNPRKFGARCKYMIMNGVLAFNIIGVTSDLPFSGYEVIDENGNKNVKVTIVDLMCNEEFSLGYMSMGV